MVIVFVSAESAEEPVEFDVIEKPFDLLKRNAFVVFRFETNFL